MRRDDCVRGGGIDRVDAVALCGQHASVDQESAGCTASARAGRTVNITSNTRNSTISEKLQLDINQCRDMAAACYLSIIGVVA